MEIKFVDWGLANNLGTHIEIHKDLKKYPELLKPILAHELQHNSSKNFFQDLILDFNKIPNLDYKKLRRFILRRPKTWIQFSPIWFKGESIIIDWGHLVIYSGLMSLLVIDTLLILLLIKNIF